MIRRVYEQTSRASLVQTVVVATDDERIRRHVLDFGGKVVMTADHHPSGTDRCFDALQQPGRKFSIRDQCSGRRTFIDPAVIDELATVLQDGTVELAPDDTSNQRGCPV